MRSPYRTRDRSDEYFRSLEHESSRRMSFSSEAIKARRVRGERIERTTEGRASPVDAGGGMYRIGEKARRMVKETEKERSPARSEGRSPRRGYARRGGK